MKYLIWDFDGTLGYRISSWTSIIEEVIRSERPDCTASVTQIREHLQGGFPWHHSEQPHLPNKSADEWWDALYPVIEKALAAAGALCGDDARRLAPNVRDHYIETTHWRLYDDTLSCLRSLKEQGWEHIVLSNHVPELPTIVQALGLAPYLTALHNSAVSGFEKPHPMAFKAVLATLVQQSNVWMIGDNPVADIAGAEAVGLRAILVRRPNPGVKYHSATLSGVAEIIGARH